MIKKRKNIKFKIAIENSPLPFGSETLKGSLSFFAWDFQEPPFFLPFLQPILTDVSFPLPGSHQKIRRDFWEVESLLVSADMSRFRLWESCFQLSILLSHFQVSFRQLFFETVQSQKTFVPTFPEGKFHDKKKGKFRVKWMVNSRAVLSYRHIRHVLKGRKILKFNTI